MAAEFRHCKSKEEVLFTCVDVTMSPINLILISSCLSSLVIGQETQFSYPGQYSYFDENSSYTYYFRYQGHDPTLIPQVCQDKKSVICVVKNATLVVNNAGQLDTVTKEDTDTSDRFSLIFKEGEHCNKTGSATQKYRTRIDYFCPDERRTYETPVVLIKGGDPCLINFFVWQQDEKCQNYQAGSDCVIDLPNFNTRLDLKVLKKQVYDVNDQFQINICDGIQYSSKCPKGVGLCGPNGVVIKAGFQILTRYNYNSGKVEVDYISKDGANASIIMDCDRNEDVKFEFIGKDHMEGGHDKYKFHVRTKHVCLSEPQNCQYFDKSSQKFYDLNGLRNVYNEWVTNDKHRTYHISVCKPLSPASAESNCPGDKTSICAENSETKESIVIANTNDSIEPKFQANDNVLILTYDQGARCNANNNYSAQIFFLCDRENIGGPEIMDILDNCTYIFEWKTVHACSQITEESHNCKVKDSFYGHTFDLTPLYQAKNDIHIGNFTMNICGRGLLSNACGSEASICYEKKPIGLKNSEKLIFADGELHLEYVGRQCTDTIKYNTNIMFLCDHDVGVGTPQLGISDECHFVFTWKTSFVCPPYDKIDCRVADENGEVFDFSDLALSDSNYQIPMRNSNEVIILNACKSLVHSTMSRCPYKSAVCLRKENSNGSFTFANLGEAKKSPFLDEYNRLVLEYPNGGLCKEKDTQETHMSTRIIFK